MLPWRMVVMEMMAQYTAVTYLREIDYIIHIICIIIHYGIVQGGHIPREIYRLGDVGAVVHEPVHLGLAVGDDGEEAAKEVKTRTKTAVQTLITVPMASKPSRSLSRRRCPGCWPW
jgi:hypothetical protein